MSEMEILQPEENLENVESIDRTEEQALQETAHEPGSRVEQTQDFEQAEAVEGVLTAAMADGEAGVRTQPEVSGTPQESAKIAQDPLTGKSYGGEQGNSSGGSSSEEEPALAEGSGEAPYAPAQGQAITEPANDDAGRIPSSEIDGNDPVFEMDGAASGQGQDFSEGNAEPGKQIGEFDPQRIDPGQLPQEKQIPVGMGKDGALFPQGGKNMPGGQGGPPQGSSTSGGGPPVNFPGGGKGKGGGKDNTIPGNSPSGRYLFLKADDSGTVTDADGKGYWAMDKNGDWHYQVIDNEEAPAEKPHEGDPIDGDFGMPYTGSTGGGEKPDPNEPVGGPDGDSGKLFPVIPKGGGSKDSGGKTPGDKDGDDDSGHFLGDANLSGSDDYVPPPDDDIPYHDLNHINAAKK